jgi:general secretion pathway protein D
MGIMRPVAVAVLLLLPVVALPAEPEPASTSDVRAASSASTMDLGKLISAVSQKTHKRFLIDPRVRGSVDLGGIDARDVTYPILLSILQIHGFAAIPDGGIVSIVPDANVRMMATPLVSPDNIKGEDADIVTTIIPVNNVNAAALAQVLRPLVPQYGILSSVPDRNAILVTDRVSNVKRVVAIIRAAEKLPEQKGQQ